MGTSLIADVLSVVGNLNQAVHSKATALKSVLGTAQGLAKAQVEAIVQQQVHMLDTAIGKRVTNTASCILGLQQREYICFCSIFL